VAIKTLNQDKFLELQIGKSTPPNPVLPLLQSTFWWRERHQSTPVSRIEGRRTEY